MSIIFPLGILLIPYFLVLAIFAFLAFFNIYNLVRYDATTHASFIVTALFLAVTTTILFLTWNGLASTDWSQEVSIGGNLTNQEINLPLQ